MGTHTRITQLTYAPKMANTSKVQNTWNRLNNLKGLDLVPNPAQNRQDVT